MQAMVDGTSLHRNYLDAETMFGHCRVRVRTADPLTANELL